jgi:two-component system sensor histidine kinase TctE
MARTEARAQGRPAERVDLAALAMDVVREFVPRALDKRIDLGFEGPGDGGLPTTGDPHVDGHAVMLRELVVNLVDNALQYTPRGGTVTVRVMPDPFGQVVVLQVEDSGPGIAPAERGLVFEPFYRALGTPVDGSGLGLAIVAEVARQHGGTVTLDDAREWHGEPRAGDGPGARFTVRLPAAAPDVPPPPAPAPDADPNEVHP